MLNEKVRTALNRTASANTCHLDTIAILKAVIS